MNILAELRRRFDSALEGLAENRAELIDMVRRSGDARFGDYQANLAMPLGKQLDRPPRDVAAEVVDRLRVEDLCETPEIAGPGFINLRLSDSWLCARLAELNRDPRLGIAQVREPRTYVIDYSAPNVAKPMHVGHIRSTVIGDALSRLLRHLGHTVISDNHLGDWGTQFGMIIYGYKHFLNSQAYQEHPVVELARLYKLVNQLVEYHAGLRKVPDLARDVENHQRALDAWQPPAEGAAKADRKAADKERRQLQNRLNEARDALAEMEKKLAAVDNSPPLAELARQHPDIPQKVLTETAKLHAGDEENRRLWHEFLPPCLETLENTYRRLGVSFDRTLGESFYQDRLAAVVKDLRDRGVARETEGAVGVFLEDFATPLLIQKQDGAFLYATTDLATIQYRMQEWSPAAMLYVVDHRQSLHFEQLFATARLWGFEQVELAHVSFGTVLGDDGRPYRTRSGDTVGLEGLLDEAVSEAARVVNERDEAAPRPELSPEAWSRVYETVGIGGLKYADLSHNRTSDYKFSYQKMLAKNGDSATYMQYAYARSQSIFARGGVDVEALRRDAPEITLTEPAERALAVQVLRFHEALDTVLEDYRPHHLTGYLFELANAFSTFFEKCPVIKAETDALRNSRFLLCDLAARTLRQGLELLGIEVVGQM